MKCLILAAAVSMAPLVAHAQEPAAYVRQAGAADRFEITEARLAQRRSRNPRIRRAADLMIADHARSTALVQAAVRRTTGRTPPPAAMTAPQARQAGDLRRTPGPAFDRAYVAQQVQAHEAALALHQGYAERGDDPQLRRAAAMIVPVVQQHLDMWRDLRNRTR